MDLSKDLLAILVGGGSCAFGDPENNLGISYVMNQMKNNFAADGRSLELINTTYECLNKE